MVGPEEQPAGADVGRSCRGLSRSERMSRCRQESRQTYDRRSHGTTEKEKQGTGRNLTSVIPFSCYSILFF